MSETETKYHQPADDSWPRWEAASRPPARAAASASAGTCWERNGGTLRYEAGREWRCCGKRWRLIIRVLGVVEEKGTGKEGAQGPPAGEKEKDTLGQGILRGSRETTLIIGPYLLWHWPQ